MADDLKKGFAQQDQNLIDPVTHERRQLLSEHLQFQHAPYVSLIVTNDDGNSKAIGRRLFECSCNR